LNPTLRDVVDLIENLAPLHLAYSFDRPGLQLGSWDQEISRIVVSLDPSVAAIAFAKRKKADLMVCHHPLIWQPLKSLVGSGPHTKAIRSLVQSNIAFYGAHTNWDVAPGGINDTLAEIFGLTEVQRIGSAPDQPHFLLTTTVPTEAAEGLRAALAKAGAGRIGHYEECAFAAPGIGSFIPGAGANPSVGTRGQREEVAELRIEMAVPGALIGSVVRALQAAHPYEEPAFQLLPDHKPKSDKITRIGLMPKPMSHREFRSLVDSCLQTKSLMWVGRNEPIEHVAVCGGGADDEWEAALSAGADAFITGEVRQATALAASEAGLTIVAAGHYATEMPGMVKLGEILSEMGLSVEVFIPKPGQAGRPL
jgi:dinuclear metal center YbgI/SA1388 family protein